MRYVRILPLRQEWAPSYLNVRPGAVNIDKAFRLVDRQGMPSLDGVRRHGGWDWFAPAGTPVLAPFDGTVVRVNESNDHYGGVYGGVLGIRREAANDGIVMRHIDPDVRLGQPVRAGDVVGYVFDWYDGGDHVHLELHRNIGSGYDYRFENVRDPEELEWVDGVATVVKPPTKDWGIESLPTRLGGTGPDVYGGWASRSGRNTQLARLSDVFGEHLTRPVKLRGDGAPYGVVVWPAPDRVGARPRWFYVSKEIRDAALERVRKANPNVKYRAFKGRANSLYSRLP